MATTSSFVNSFFGIINSKISFTSITDNIGAFLPPFDLHIHDKQHRQHCHHHMMMPSSPASYLIICHSSITFRILESTFNPVATAGHLTKSLNACICRCIRELVFYFLFTFILAEDQKCLFPG